MARWETAEKGGEGKGKGGRKRGKEAEKDGKWRRAKEGQGRVAR